MKLQQLCVSNILIGVLLWGGAIESSRAQSSKPSSEKSSRHGSDPGSGPKPLNASATSIPTSLLVAPSSSCSGSVALAFVIDKSRSNDLTEPKVLEANKQAVMSAINSLGSDTAITIIGFDDFPFLILKIGTIAEHGLEKIENRVSRLFAAGRTKLLPALEEAKRQLQRAQASCRHIIMLTDGKVDPEDLKATMLLEESWRDSSTFSVAIFGSSNEFAAFTTVVKNSGGFMLINASRERFLEQFASQMRVLLQPKPRT